MSDTIDVTNASITKFLTIVSVRHSDSLLENIRWWLEPQEKETPNYQLLTVVKLEKEQKVILCKLPNNISGDSEEANSVINESILLECNYSALIVAAKIQGSYHIRIFQDGGQLTSGIAAFSTSDDNLIQDLDNVVDQPTIDAALENSLVKRILSSMDYLSSYPLEGATLIARSYDTFADLPTETELETGDYPVIDILFAYKKVFGQAIETFSSEHFGIKYTGHGSPEGIFEEDLGKGQQSQFLAYVTERLGKNIDFCDWSTNCNVASLLNLEEQYQYTDYIIASDLFRGGSGFMSTDYSQRPSEIFYTYFTPERTIRQAIEAMLDAYEDCWTAQKIDRDWWNRWSIWQSLATFDTHEYASFREKANLGDLWKNPKLYGNVSECYEEKFFYDIKPSDSPSGESHYYNHSIDLWDILNNYIKRRYPDLETDFTEKVRFKYVTNRKAFEEPWTQANGLQIPQRYFVD